MSKPIVSLNLMVDKSSGRLIFAESNSHFADILLSFLTIPLSSILRLTANSNTSLGSINNLFASVENLTGDCFHSEACRAMLLQPMNSASNLLPPLRINYDTGSHRVCSSYLCNDRSCYAKGLSFYANARCICGKIMDRSQHFVADQSNVLSNAGLKSGVFLEDSFRLTITDDLRIFQSSSEVSIDLLAKLDINQSSSIEAVHVDVTIEKVPFQSDSAEAGVQPADKSNYPQPASSSTSSSPSPGFLLSKHTVLMLMAKPVTLNLIVDKSCNRVRFAESDGHFVDILLSLLTLPLGSILQLTNQSIGSINNLLQSVQNLDNIYFSSEACRFMLLHPSNSASDIFSSLSIKYDNISNLFAFHYTCSSCSNGLLCFYANARCQCGKLMDKKLEFMAEAASNNAEYCSVFFNDAFKFTINDDLHVSQCSVEFAIEQLSKLDIKQMSSLESMSMNITVFQE